MKKILLVLVCLLSFAGSLPLNAFPEMVRYGYPSCVACHFNTNGGGLLKPFGRAISSDLLSTWGREGEGDFLYGAVKFPDWFSVGGDIRTVQVYQKTPTFKKGQFILMQSDLEGAAQVKEWTVVASAGVQQIRKGRDQPSTYPFISRRHYVIYRPDAEWLLQVGRFYQAFGINTPDHVIATKRGLGWDEGGETYNLQVAWLAQRHDVFVTLNAGRPDTPELNRERGVAVRGRYYLGSSSRLGLSYFYGENTVASRHVWGPFAEIGLSPHAFILTEIDFQGRSAGASQTAGAATYTKIDYEWIQGIHTYLTYDYLKRDLNDSTSVSYAFGVGLQWFPRSHFEINTSWQKRRVEAISPTFRTSRG